jgi:hypothetical protein
VCACACWHTHTCSKFCRAWQHLLGNSAHAGCHTEFIDRHKMLTLKPYFYCRRQSKVAGCEIWWVRWLLHECDLCVCQEMLHCHTCVIWGIVAVQDPSIMLFFWSFSPHFDPYTWQHRNTVSSVHSCPSRNNIG